MNAMAMVGDALNEGLVVGLDQARDRARCGGKAEPLARAMAAGHRVPAGFVVTTEAQGRDDLAALLQEQAAALGGGPFAVRSSAVGEDGREHSFAGQLQTELGVVPADLLSAVQACWASAKAQRVLRYGGELGAVAVIVQRMVPADAAGVAFSADPQTGERDVAIVEAVPSLGDRLVEGAESPERWRVSGDEAERERRRNGEALSVEDAQRVAELTRAMERLFGAPQDVEWAIADGELYLLQSRPITALPAAPVPIERVLPEGGWDRDDHHGVLSPLGWAWLKAYPPALAEAFKASGAPLERIEHVRVGGHLYQRMVMQGPEDAAPPPRWVLWLASRLVPGLRRANRIAEAFLDDERYMDVLDEWEGGGRAAMRQAVDDLFVAAPEELSDEELLTRLEAAMQICHDGLAKHAFMHGPCFFGLGKLALFIEDELGWEHDRIYELVMGSSDATTQLHDELEEIVREHGAELTEDGPLPLPLATALGGWLEDNRLRMMHYDPKNPSLGERPEVVRSIVDNIVHEVLTDSVEPRSSRWREVLEEGVGQLDDARAAELRRLVEVARKGYWLREENAVQAVSRPAGLLRYFVLELGRRLEPRLADRTHAVYLDPAEHAPALAGELEDLGALVERRRGEESWALQHRGPKRLGPPKPPPPPPDVFPRGMRRMMRVIHWLEGTMESPEPSEGDVLQGVGIGHHAVMGTARVVRRPEQMASVRPGEVVICRVTSPEWAVGFGRVGALVTDEGGMLSHPAIVAREFDLPAIIGTEVATTRIHDGDRVRVDPVAGTVTLLRGETL